MLDADAACSPTLTMGVQWSKLAMSMHEDACRWQCWSVTITCMAISSRRWAELRLRRVLGPKLAEFEQVAAARRSKSARENPLQRGAKMDTASWQIVLLGSSGTSSSGSGSRVSVDESVTTSEDDLEGGCEQVDALRHCPTSRPSPQ